jgi:hypothetical protein
MTTRIALIAALVFAAGIILAALAGMALAAAGDYERALGADVARTMGKSDPSIPDDVEDAYWRCWARGFVATQVKLADVPKLDAGDAELIKLWGGRAEKALLSPKAFANRQIDEWMSRECAGPLAKLRSYL